MKTMAIIFGLIFLIIGALGFVPSLTPHNLLLGIFHVDALHNIIHLATGAVALWAGATSARASRLFFQIFGVIYAFVAILGFVYGNAPILGVLANNIADAWLHTAIALVSLYMGFIHKEACAVCGKTELHTHDDTSCKICDKKEPHTHDEENR